MSNEEMGAFIRRLSEANTDLTCQENYGATGKLRWVSDTCCTTGTDFSSLGETLWAALEALAAKMEAAS